MSVLFDEIKKQSRRLAPEEKAELAGILLDELHPFKNDEIQQAWIAEAERRLDAYLRGEMEALPGDEVMACAREIRRK